MMKNHLPRPASPAGSKRGRVLIVQLIAASITLGAGLCLFSDRAGADTTVQAGTLYTDQSGLEAVRRDLAQIDGYASSRNYENASLIVGDDIRARNIYRAYIRRAAAISQDLLKVRQRLDLQERRFTLQQLGAMTQRLTLDNRRFQGTFQHGEDHFQTYRLIEKAVFNLEDMVNYWRMARHDRRFFRGTAHEKRTDDEVLKFKLQTALNAIDALQQILDTRQALAQDLQED